MEMASRGGDYVASFFVLQGDANGDGVVSNNDMLVVDAALGSLTGTSNWDPNADLNRDGAVTTGDRIIVYNALGNSITPPAGQGSQVVPAVAASLPAWSFEGSTQETIANALPADSPVGGITFGAGAGAITLGGNAVELNGNVTNQSSSTQIVNLPLTLIGGNRTINTAVGNVTIAGDIGQSGGGLGITKTGSGTLVLSGADTYGGGTAVNEGTLVATSRRRLACWHKLGRRGGWSLHLRSELDCGKRLSRNNCRDRPEHSRSVCRQQPIQRRACDLTRR